MKQKFSVFWPVFFHKLISGVWLLAVSVVIVLGVTYAVSTGPRSDATAIGLILGVWVLLWMHDAVTDRP